MMRDDVPREDKDGNPRPLPAGSNPDMGAYECGAPLPSIYVENVLSGTRFDTIQEAVDNAMPMDRLVIHGRGTLTENVNIDKPLTITVDSESEITVEADDPSSPVFMIMADEVTLERMTITGANEVVPGRPVAGIYLYGVMECRIRNNHITGNFYGIYMDHVTWCTVSDNHIDSNIYSGVYLVSSSAPDEFSRSEFTRNVIEGNRFGIFLDRTEGNLFYFNDFIGNTEAHVRGHGLTNLWSSPDELIYSYHGSIFTGRLGNHWDDYDGEDADSDGIGDTPYVLDDANEDEFPLTDSISGYHIGDEIPRPVHNISTGQDFLRIQDAIDSPATRDGHVILVDPGRYTENVVVNKSLRITSRSGSPSDTVVQAADSNRSVFRIVADGVAIGGFTISGANATLSGSAGIELFRVRDCTITNNVLAGNWYGIALNLSEENTILRNEIRGNDDGIYLFDSSDNTICNNTVSGNNDTGILLDRNGRHNQISNNRIEDNHNRGIRLWRNSSYNLIFRNVITGNGVGLSMESVADNRIFLNDFVENGDNLFIPTADPDTEWHTPTEVIYEYHDERITGYLGNYWDDYHERQPDGVDADSDGVWDLPYPIENDNDDPYPLASSSDNYVTEEVPITAISVYPQRVRFNTVILGEVSEPHPVILTNLGRSPLSFRIEIDGDPEGSFEVRSGACSVLRGGGSCRLSVIFHPSSLGLKRATLVIIPEDLDERVEVELSGIAGLIGLPRTGQENRPTAGNWGVDGVVRAGVPWPLDATERFIDNGDGTVTDRLTGLMWLRNANCLRTHHPEMDRDGVLDGLVPRGFAIGFIERLNDGTYADCNAGYTDWRLPNINELESLVNYGADPLYQWLMSWRSSTYSVFENVFWNFYWSSTLTRRGRQQYGYGINMDMGYIDYEAITGRDEFGGVWPVRGPVDTVEPLVRLPKISDTDEGPGVEWPSERFEVYEDFIVDRLTGLMWSKDADLMNGSVHWSEAKEHVASLTIGGYDDWRIPNYRELRSLINYGTSDRVGYLLSEGFEEVRSIYWDSTILPYSLSIGDGYSYLPTTRRPRYYVIAVRGGILRNVDMDTRLDFEEWGASGDQVDYDGNDDGIPDSRQANVTSLHTFDGRRYVTIESPEGTALVDVRSLDPEGMPSGPPSGVEFPWGLFSFTIEGIPVGGSVTVTIYLGHPREVPTTYYKYGPEPDNLSPHWYEFTFDGSTGAEIAGDRIVLHFVDGGRGDDDLSPNGRIVDANGPGISISDQKISVSPLILNFGSVAPGESREMSVTVRNRGSKELVIGSIAISGENASEFRIRQDNCSNQTIQPGGSCDLVVVFEPESLGSKSATLDIPSDDPETPLVNVMLIGQGSVLGDVSQNGQVTAYDASVILRYLVGSEQLSEDQLAVADVSGNGAVSAYDAAVILRFVVGLIDSLPGSGESAPPIEGEDRIVSLPYLKARAGERITVPLLVDDPTGIISGELTLKFNVKALKFVEARSDFNLETRLEGSRLKLAFAGAREERSKALVYLTFEVMESSLEDVRLNLMEARLNEGVKVKLKDGMVELIPTRTVLLQNYPNPFNPETWMPFRLAEDGRVVIRIYDVIGRKIRELDLGYREAGNYTSRSKAAHWDGRNELGEKVASGVYIYQLQVGEKAFARRMVILK
jgi:parallel beta-helix repeat protein